MKNLSKLAIVSLIAGCSMVSCTSYSAEDYMNDMKTLTEETIRNASDYTEEDWKRVGEEYRAINEKGKKTLERLTDEQKKELEKYAEEMADKAAEFDHEELKVQFEDIMDQADKFIDGIMQQIEKD